MKRFKIESVFAWTVATMLAVALTLSAYWILWPIDVIEISRSEFVNGNGKIGTYQGADKNFLGKTFHQFKGGEVVAINLTYDKWLPLTADLAKYMTKLDEPNKGLVVTIIAASRPGHLPVGENQHSMTSFIIPVTAPPGVYDMTSTARYRVNPLRDFYERWTSQPYEVLPR